MTNTILDKNLLKELGLENLPDDKKTSLLLDVGRIIQQNVILRVLSELKEEDKDEFEKLLAEKAGDQQAILNFLQTKIPNLEIIIAGEIENFKKESADIIKSVVNK